MNCAVEKITPKKAAEYLQSNCENNRNINKNRVRVYAQDMAAGAWQLNGEAIRFNKDGVLLDGQHRLSAIIMAGIPVQMLVIRDVGNEVDLYDRGFGRNTKDSLLMGGLDSTLTNNATCAMAKLSVQVDTGKNFASDYAIREFLIENEQTVRDAYAICARYSGGAKTQGRLSTSNSIIMLAVYSALKDGASMDDLSKFCEVYSTGFYDGKEQSAAVVIRNDVQGGVIRLYGGQIDRFSALWKFEKAVYDFCHRIPRKVTYKGWDKRVY